MLPIVPAVLVVASVSPRVSVNIRRKLPAPPEAASAAWLDYTWSSGGGLPAVVLPKDEAQWSRGEAPAKRLVLPLALEEELQPAGQDQDLTTHRYRVTDDGLLRSELVAGSHTAEVKFEPDGADACELIWSCEYDVQARQPFWQKFTDFNINAAADNLASYLAEPARPYWFSPLEAFGPIDDEARPPASELPLLLVLPGLDGSAVTCWTQYPVSFTRT